MLQPRDVGHQRPGRSIMAGGRRDQFCILIGLPADLLAAGHSPECAGVSSRGGTKLTGPTPAFERSKSVRSRGRQFSCARFRLTSCRILHVWQQLGQRARLNPLASSMMW